jgi:hypothetical protein
VERVPELLDMVSAGLNIMDLERTSAEERAAFSESYRKHDGRPHTGFDFLLANEQGAPALKRYRRQLYAFSRVEASVFPRSDTAGLLGAIEGIGFISYYAVTGYLAGIRYMAMRLLRAGFTKDEIIEAICIGYPRTGPSGVERIAEALEGLDWTPRGPRVDWAAIGWSADPDAFRSGIDESVLEVLPGEIDRIKTWYLETIGEIPLYVRHLARYQPLLLKMYRLRLEHVVVTLPKQLVATSLLLLSALLGEKHAIRENALLCRAFGVAEGDALAAVHLVSPFGSEMWSAVEEAAGDVFERWSEMAELAQDLRLIDTGSR